MESLVKLHSISETARLLGVGKDAIYELIRHGRLGYIELGKRKKIAFTEIQSFIANNTKHQTGNSTVEGEPNTITSLTKQKSKVSSLDGAKILEKIMKEN